MTANREEKTSTIQRLEMGDSSCLMLRCNECHYRSQIITDVTRSRVCQERARGPVEGSKFYNVHAESSYWIMACYNHFVNEVYMHCS